MTGGKVPGRRAADETAVWLLACGAELQRAHNDERFAYECVQARWQQSDRTAQSTHPDVKVKACAHAAPYDAKGTFSCAEARLLARRHVCRLVCSQVVCIAGALRKHAQTTAVT